MKTTETPTNKAELDKFLMIERALIMELERINMIMGKWPVSHSLYIEMSKKQIIAQKTITEIKHEILKLEQDEPTETPTSELQKQLKDIYDQLAERNSSCIIAYDKPNSIETYCAGSTAFIKKIIISILKQI